MKQIVTLEQRGYNAGSSPAYIGFGPIGAWQSSRFFYRTVFGVATTVRKFRLISSAQAAAGTTITLTIMKSDVDTALALTLTDASALDLDTGATSVAFAAGDDIVIKGERTGSPGTPIFWISAEFETADGSSVVLLPMTGAVVSPGMRRGALGDGGWTTNPASTIQDVIPCDGTITASCALFRTSSGTTDQFESTVYLDGVAQDGTGGTPDTRCQTSIGNFGKGVGTFSLPVTAGQLVHTEQVRLAGSGGLVAFTTSLVFVANTPGESIIAGRSSTPPTSNGSFYHQILEDDSNWETFINARRQKGVAASFSIKKLHVRKEASPSPGAYAIAVVKNDVATALAVTVTAAGVVSDVVDFVNIKDGDTFMLEDVASGSPTGGNLMWSAVQFFVECQLASPGPSICGDENVLTWIEHTHRKTDASTETRVTSDAQLNDLSDYYFGKKLGVIQRLPEITRRSSNIRGQWRPSTMRWRESETDRAVRARYHSSLSYPVTNTTDVCRMIRESDYVARAEARLMFIGHRLQSEPAEDLSIEHESSDELARGVIVAGEEVQCPRRTFASEYTPGIQAELIDVPEPIIYGRQSDALSGDTPPDLTGSATWGGFMDGSFPIFGWAPLAAGPAAPTGVTVTPIGSGGNLMLGGHPSNRYYAIVWHVDASGNEGDPDTFDQRRGAVASAVIVANNSQIQVDWTETGTPTKTRIALGYLDGNGNISYPQQAEVAGGVTTFTFDDSPFGGAIATGATSYSFVAFAYYRAAAKMGDGSWTALSTPEGFGSTGPYRRPARLEFTNVPAGAVEIGIWEFATAVPTNPLGYWTIPYTGVETFIDNDWLGTGKISSAFMPEEIGRLDLSAYYGGQELVPFDGQYYHRWFVSAHALAFFQPYVDGVAVLSSEFQWQWPGQPGYSDRFGLPRYRDFNNRRYFVLYGLSTHAQVMDVVAGTRTLRANVHGIETLGDGTGALITDGFDQFLHWLVNWGPLGDYQSGAWLDTPTWDPIAPHCKVNAESFRQRRDEAVAALPGGIECSGVIAEHAAMRDWMAKWLLSLDARLTQNAAGQWTLTAHDPAATPSATYTEIRHVQQHSVKFTPLHDEHWTRIPYVFGYDHATRVWQQKGTETSLNEESAYGERRPGPEFQLAFIQSPTIAQWIMARVRARHEVLPWRVEFETIDLCGTNSDNGHVIGLTGTWGLGPTGWQAFPIFLEDHTTLPDPQRTRLSGRTNVAPQESP